MATPNFSAELLNALLLHVQQQLPTDILTLGRAWELYVAARSGQVRSHDSDIGRMGHLQRILCSDRQVATLTLTDIDAYRAQRRTELTIRKTTPSVATLNREIEVLARVISFAVSRKLLRSNPLAGLQYEPEHNTREVIVDDALLERILAVCKSWLRTFVLVAIDSGCRRNELVRLRWDEIDQERGLIRIETNDTKTRKGRVTVLSERAREALLDVARRSQWVFSNQNGDRFHPAHVTKHFRETMQRAGITDAAGREILLHDLRRSFVTMARRRGVAETTVMKMSGHETHLVFKRYSISGVEDVLRARDVLDASHRVTDPSASVPSRRRKRARAV